MFSVISSLMMLVQEVFNSQTANVSADEIGEP